MPETGDTRRPRDIGGRVTQLAAHVLTVDDVPANHERPPQQRRGVREITGPERPAHPRGRDPLAVAVGNGIQHAHLERAFALHRFQQRHVTHALVAEAEIAAHPDLAGAHARHQHLAHEILRAHRHQRRVEIQQQQFLDAGIGEPPQLLAHG